MDITDRLILSDRRRRLGLTQAKLASIIPSRVGCKRVLTNTAINAFETGRRNPHPVTLAAWKSALDLMEAANA